DLEAELNNRQQAARSRSLLLRFCQRIELAYVHKHSARTGGLFCGPSVPQPRFDCQRKLYLKLGKLAEEQRPGHLSAWQTAEPVLAAFLRWQSMQPAMVVTLVALIMISIWSTGPWHASQGILASRCERWFQ